MIKNLPQWWRVEKLGKVAEYINGKAFKPSEWAESGLPIVRIQNLNGNENYNFYDGEIEEKYLIHKGDILISWSASLDVYKWDKEEAVLNQHIFKTKINNKLITDDYFYYTIKKALVKILSNLHGSTMQHITKGRFENIDILLPPLPQQEKIVKVLDNSSSLIEQQKQLIEKYDVFLKSKFIEMFGDPITNPMGWKKTTCIQVADCIVPGRDKPKSFSGTYMPWITTGDLVDKKAISHSNSNLMLSKEEVEEVRAKIIPENSIVFTCVGDLGIVSITKKPIVINQQLHSFQCKEDVVNNYFLMFNISMQKQYMYKMATSTTVPYMNKTTCNNIPTILPPIELQNKFASIVEKVEAIKEKETQKLNHLETLHVSLMGKAFKGEIV
jgi:type I restriction enzyme S subunit